MRFRLRTLLLVVTAAALALAWVFPQVRYERVVVRTADGSRTVVRRQVPAWLRWLVGEHVGVRDAEVALHKPTAHDLRRLSGVEFLTLDGSTVGDGELGCLLHLDDLKGLYLDETHVTDDGMALIAQLPRLEELALARTHVGDAGLHHLAQARSLKSIDLQGTNVTERGISQLRAALPALDVLQ